MARLKWDGSLRAEEEHARALREHPPRPKPKPENKKPRKRKRRKGKGPRPPPRGIPYSEYLKSEWWQWRSRKAKKRAKWKCQKCNSREAIQVHHKTYENKGREKDQDLIVLCRPCHEAEHEGWIHANNHLDSI